METNLSLDELRPYAAAVEGSLLVWPAIGVMATAFFMSFHFDNAALKGVAIALYVIGVFVAVGWQAKKTGVQPRYGSMPEPLKKNMIAFWVGSTAVAGIAMALAFATNFIVAGLVVGICFTAAGVAYHLRSRSIMGRLVAAAA